MAKPGTGKPHQLLTTHSNSHQHRRDLDVLNQQTIQQSQDQDQDAENPQTELKQPQTQTKSQRAQDRISKD